MTAKIELKTIKGYTYPIHLDCFISGDTKYPWESGGGMHLWVIGAEYGVLAVVWERCEQDAIDAAMNADKLDSLLIPEEDIDPELDEAGKYLRAGNAGEIIDGDNLWMDEIAKSEIPLRLYVAMLSLIHI